MALDSARTPRRKPARPILVFCAATFLYSWAWIVVAALGMAGRIHLPFPPDAAVAMARYGPSLAALACIAVTTGTPGLAAIGRRLVAGRVGAAWIALVLLVDAVFYVVVLAVGSIFDPRIPRLDGSVLATLPGAWVAGVLQQIPTSGIGEEIGWRGLLLPLLLRRMSPLRAAVVLVPIVSLWHLKASFVAVGIAHGFPAFLAVYLPDMAGRFALSLPSIVFFVYVFCRTQGSLLVMVLAHAAANAAYFWVDDLVGPAKPPLFWGLYWVLLAALGLWSARGLARRPCGRLPDTDVYCG